MCSLGSRKYTSWASVDNNHGVCSQEATLDYLGLPLCFSKPTRSVWTTLISSFDKKLAGWKGSFLSLGGRLILIHSTLSALPVHIMTLFHVPTWVIQCIDQIRRRFLWFGCHKIKGFILISWHKVLASLEEGGMGIKDLSIFNLSLLCRQWWKILLGSLAM